MILAETISATNDNLRNPGAQEYASHCLPPTEQCTDLE